MPPETTRQGPRRPSQARSVARRAHILEVAHQILVTAGLAAMTTTSVARAAGVPVGSVYQYFADKQALVDELAIGYLGAFDELLDELSNSGELWDDPVPLVFDGYVRLIRGSPGFRALWLDRQLSPETLEADRALNLRIAAGLAFTLVDRKNRKVTEADLLAAQVAVETADALLREAFRRDPGGDDAFLVQARRMLALYAADAGFGSAVPPAAAEGDAC